MWIWLYQAQKLMEFFKKIEKNIRINYMFTRILKLISVQLYCTHIAACIFYYLATNIPEENEGSTWFQSSSLRDYHYTHFREISLSKLYITSLYFTITTMYTIGYGDVYAVNRKEMIFLMTYISFGIIVGAYVIGKLIAHIVKGSKREIFSDKLTNIIKYMKRHKVAKHIKAKIKGLVRFGYTSSYCEPKVLDDILVFIKGKVTEYLRTSEIAHVTLFNNCSQEFLTGISMRMKEELFLLGRW